MEELKSLKNPTRLLTIFMFLAVFVSSIGADGLAKVLPGVNPAFLAGIVSVCAYAVAQYGTEKRIVRAEELKDQEYQEEETEDLSDSIEDINLDDDIEELIDDGV